MWVKIRPLGGYNFSPSVTPVESGSMQSRKNGSSETVPALGTTDPTLIKRQKIDDGQTQ